MSNLPLFDVAGSALQAQSVRLNTIAPGATETPLLQAGLEDPRFGESIAKFADAGKFDLVLMGSHGHGTLGNLVMGSVATQVLALSKVPVLLVR